MANERPHLTVYNEISLDGKITGFDGDGIRYYARGFRWRSDAILMGSITAQAFGPNESPEEQLADLPPLEPAGLPPGFADLVQEPRPVLVVPDSGGRLRNWTHARAQPWYGRIIVLVGERTPTEYLEHLDRRGIEHLTAGDERVDLSLALRRTAPGARRPIDPYGLGRRPQRCPARRRSGGPDRGDHRATHRQRPGGADPHPAAGRRWPTRPRCGCVESEVLDDGALWLVYATSPAPRSVH